MKVIIVGAGQTLFFLCRNFTAGGHEVVIINPDQDECVQLARRLKATVICGDGSDSTLLEESGALGADVVLAVTPRDHDNLVICQLASLMFGVPRTVAVVSDPDNTAVFERLGVTAFATTHIISNLIEQKASLEQVMNLLPVGEGRVNVTEVILDDNSPVAGKQLKDIVLPENALVAVVIRGERPIVPRGSNRLLSGDQVVLITLPENHGRVLKVFTGEDK
jgi:trk system potassium uptake protein TrkA